MEEENNHINFDEELVDVPLVPMLQAAEAHERKYRPAQSRFTRKQTTKAKVKKKRKIAQKSRRKNQRRSRGN